MNRRKLLSMCGQAVVGIAAAPFVAGATPVDALQKQRSIALRLTLRNQDIVSAVVENYKANGEIRQILTPRVIAGNAFPEER